MVPACIRILVMIAFRTRLFCCWWIIKNEQKKRKKRTRIILPNFWEPSRSQIIRMILIRQRASRAENYGLTNNDHISPETNQNKLILYCDVFEVIWVWGICQDPSGFVRQQKERWNIYITCHSDAVKLFCALIYTLAIFHRDLRFFFRFHFSLRSLTYDMLYPPLANCQPNCERM